MAAAACASSEAGAPEPSAAPAAAADGGSEAAAAPPCAADLASDLRNCGACLHDCFGGACAGGVCQVVTVATVEGTLAIACTDDEIVYANGIGGNGGVLGRVRLGSAPIAILAGLDGPQWPLVTTSHIYWLEAGSLRRTPRDRAGAAEVVVTPPAGSSLTRPVEHDGNVYVGSTLSAGSKITTTVWRAPVAGGVAAAIVTTDGRLAPDDALAVSAKGIFAASAFAIWTTPLAGGTPTVLTKDGRRATRARDARARRASGVQRRAQRGEECSRLHPFRAGRARSLSSSRVMTPRPVWHASCGCRMHEC